MRHKICISGHAFSLRPVELADAQRIIDIRLEDLERNRFIHQISSSVKDQEAWIEQYFARDNDYYFAVVNNASNQVEGFIGIYNIDNDHNCSEWGRFVVRKGSLGAIEATALCFNVAFEVLGLDMLYGTIIADNKKSLSFHSRIGVIATENSTKLCMSADCSESEAADTIPVQLSRERYLAISKPLLDSLAVSVSRWSGENQ